MEQPLLDIVIVSSTGTRELLRDCLESLRRHPPTLGPSRVYVADNASSDGTAGMVRDEYPEVGLAVMPGNEGFCVANNHWLRRTDAPFALLLNPDTEVTAGAIDLVLERIREQDRVGIAGCRLIQRDGTFDHAAKRSFPTPLGALAHFTGLGRRPGAGRRLAQYRAPDMPENGSGPVDAVNGAFMLVRRTAMDQVGLLDEGYPTPGMEDLDWCYRFAEAGWTTWYEGAATVIHVKGAATVSRKGAARHRSLRHNLAFHRSMGRFYRKFYSGRNPALDFAVYLGIALKFTVAATRSTVARRGFS
jgi:N-acetylglucosaminyl-diphospho-decaprenol L-rhamnosyltransferase